MGMRDQYMKKYAAPYQKYIDMQGKMNSNAGPPPPANAADCHNMTDLKAWRAGQEKQLQFIPSAYRFGPEGTIKSQYEENKARIAQEYKTAGKAMEIDDDDQMKSERAAAPEAHDKVKQDNVRPATTEV